MLSGFSSTGTRKSRTKTASGTIATAKILLEHDSNTNRLLDNNLFKTNDKDRMAVVSKITQKMKNFKRLYL